MRTALKLFFIINFFCLSTYVRAQENISPKEIIRKSEEKRRGIKSSYAEMKITTIRKKWTKEMKMKSWSKGSEFSLIVITSPEKEAGRATLKRHKEVWSWMPGIKKTIKLPPSMMGQSWMGTDLTNDDLVQESSNITDYKHQLLKDTVIREKLCYKVLLIPKEEAAVVWGKVIIFVEKTDFIQLRTELYDEDEYLVNIMSASNIKVMDGIKMATKIEFVAFEKKGQKTIVEFLNMDFDIPIEDDFFTIENMKKVK